VGLQDLACLIPFRRPREDCLNNSLEKTSVPKINRNGVNGSPCLSPRAGVKKPNGLPLMSMENEGEVTHIRIQLIQVGWKPSLLKWSRGN